MQVDPSPRVARPWFQFIRGAHAAQKPAAASAMPAYSAEEAAATAKHSALVYGNWSNAPAQKRIESQLREWGYSQVKFFDVNGTQAYIASNDHEVMVVFRGTEPRKLEDLAADLQPGQVPFNGQGEVRKGFKRAFDDAWPAMLAEIRYLQAEKPRALNFTGHSLGGAHATLGAKDAVDKGLAVRSVYTFGSPRVGNREFAAAYDKALGNRTYRHVNNNDRIARLPYDFMQGVTFGLYDDFMDFLGFHPSIWAHVADANERYFKLDGSVLVGRGYFSKFADRVKGRTETPAKLITDGFKDHDIRRYVDLTAAAAIRERVAAGVAEVIPAKPTEYRDGFTPR